mmetsp:Transcript_6346/g.15307  ORF Transcript_6346/g.15307 Transcript_6346/m.15307 type:complete len:205 (+) Transcript_6346:325-939(+)
MCGVELLLFLVRVARHLYLTHRSLEFGVGFLLHFLLVVLVLIAVKVPHDLPRLLFHFPVVASCSVNGGHVEGRQGIQVEVQQGLYRHELKGCPRNWSSAAGECGDEEGDDVHKVEEIQQLESILQQLDFGECPDCEEEQPDDVHASGEKEPELEGPEGDNVLAEEVEGVVGLLPRRVQKVHRRRHPDVRGKAQLEAHASPWLGL